MSTSSYSNLLSVGEAWSRSIPVFSAVLLALLASSVLTLRVHANPIPTPVVPLRMEDVKVRIWFEDGSYVACVEGLYELGEPIGYGGPLTLRFPVPEGSSDVSVYLEDNPVEFAKTSGRYACRPIEVPFEVLKWSIPGGGGYTVRVVYRHRLIDFGNGTYLLVYPLGSSKLAPNATYAKGCSYSIMVTVDTPPGLEVDFEVLEKIVDPKTGSSFYRWRKVNLNGSTFESKGRLELTNMFDDFYVKLTASQAEPERWIPYKPKPGEVGEPRISVLDRRVNVTVRFTFRHSGFKVESSYRVVDREARFNFDVYEWTEVSLPVITVKESTIASEPLEPGEYTVRVFVSGVEVASTRVEVPGGLDASTPHTWLTPVLTGLVLAGLAVLVLSQLLRWRRL